MKVYTWFIMLFASNSYKAILVEWLCVVALQGCHALGSGRSAGSIRKAGALA
ncbi:MAG: hypothetical protein ABIP95_00785 [Pelobium sp.]